ncbi:putative exported protein of unknown function [Pseudoalteromonas luteoviolacea B = ATCC 29581]|nr:putative exported protein of unknown function [Pseudoalteromonas luteoviolacea B = ATCC 29581]
MLYRHSQFGTTIVTILGSSILLLIGLLISQPTGAKESIWLAILLLSMVTFLFSTLTIEVKGNHISWFFGPRFWRKTLNFNEVRSVKVIRYPWYVGFGIRLTSTGWLYTVSGLSAVELLLKDGTTVSLGSNEAEELAAVVENKLTTSSL